MQNGSGKRGEIRAGVIPTRFCALTFAPSSPPGTNSRLRIWTTARPFATARAFAVGVAVVEFPQTVPDSQFTATETPLAWFWPGFFATGCITLFTRQWKAESTTLPSILLSRFGIGGTNAGDGTMARIIDAINSAEFGRLAGRPKRYLMAIGSDHSRILSRV